VLGRRNRCTAENLLLCRFVRHRSHMTLLGLEPGPPRWKPATNRLSYYTAQSART
jgi:hypothetical protein